MLVRRRGWKHLGKLIVRKVAGRVSPGQGRAGFQLGEVEVAVLRDSGGLVGSWRGRNCHVQILKNMQLKNKLFFCLSYNKFI